MMGMDFLRLNKVLKKHKWKSNESKEDIDKLRKKEDRLSKIGIVLFVLILFGAIALSV